MSSSSSVPNVPNLPSDCNGCGHPFTVHHGLACSLGGLVLACHNELHDEELADLAVCAFTPSAVHDEPLIHPCPQCTPVTPLASATSAPSAPPSPPNDDHGDLLIHGLWSSATDCILDVLSTEMDAKTYQSKDPMKVFASQHEKSKKKKYLAYCLAQHCHFIPFILSADGSLAMKLMLCFVSWLANMPRKLTKLIQWFVAVNKLSDRDLAQMRKENLVQFGQLIPFMCKCISIAILCATHIIFKAPIFPMAI